MRSLSFFVITFLICFGSTGHAASFKSNGDIIGEIRHYTVQKEDNLYEIARRHDIGIVELLAANPGVKVWQPEPGTQLRLTTQHILPPVQEGIVINLSELRLFYFLPGGRVMTFPIGIGREGWQTPLGTTVITKKRKAPSWIPPASIRAENPDLPDIIPAGPDNPLGAFALNLGWPGYAIHGTNRPYGIGKRSTHGCIRLYPEDIKALFGAVEEGTPVTVIDTPYKLGWRGDTLFLEVTPTQKQSDAIAKYRQLAPISIPDIYQAVREAAGEDTEIRWHVVEKAIARRSGIPAAIGQK